jgi:hypothetical protein
MQMNAAHPQSRTKLRISEQRLQRLSLWLALTIAWFAAHVLGAIAPQMAARLLNQHAHSARLLLVARAVKRIGFTAQHMPSRVERRRLTCRGVAGVLMRSALRRGTLSDRAQALCTALAEAERWIGYIARRLQRGFTKLRILPKPRRVYLRAAVQAPPPEIHASIAPNSS